MATRNWGDEGRSRTRLFGLPWYGKILRSRGHRRRLEPIVMRDTSLRARLVTCCLVCPPLYPRHWRRSSCFADIARLPLQDITNDYHVYIKGAPRVISPPLQYASEGAESRVECLVQAVPPATRVQWFKDG